MTFRLFTQDLVDLQKIVMVFQGQIMIVYLPASVTDHETLPVIECLMDHQYPATQGPVSPTQLFISFVEESFGHGS